MPHLMEPLGEPAHLRALSFVAALFGAFAQLVSLFADGRLKVWTTIFVVLAFFCCAAFHAASESFLALVSLLVVGVLLALVTSAVGAKVGLPFGSFDYADHTWMRIAGVPVIVPFAWAMIGWPAFVAGRVINKPLVGAVILGGWDLFFDPEMVDDGRWTWAKTAWPKINGIPLSNLIGWLLVGALMMFLLDRSVNHVIDYEGIPLLVLGWSFAIGVIGNLVFRGLSGSAIAGALVMGAALAPVVLAVMNNSPGRRRGSSQSPRDV